MAELDPHRNNVDASPDRVSRRQVLSVVAWATPTIVLATAVPAYAASGAGLVVVDAIAATGSGTVITVNGKPEEDPWRIFVSVTNNSADIETVTVVLTASAGTFAGDDTM